MELSLALEYLWVLVVLVGLEGILAADNAVVMAVMVKHLPHEQQKKALFYGLIGAFVMRLGSLFLITTLMDVWQVQAIGAVYLFYIAANNLIKKYFSNRNTEKGQVKKNSSFWMTVLKVEVADLAFAVDSMLAAVALAVTLTPTGWFTIGGIDGAQFSVMFLGGFIGLVIMRFAANKFVQLLEKCPTLETAAFFIVGWVGVKLAIFTLAHPKVAIIDEHFPESLGWKATFWIVLIGIAVVGFFLSGKKVTDVNQTNEQ